MSTPVRPAYLIYRWMWSSLDWLYPPRCAGCGQVGSRWCQACQAGVQRLVLPLCKTCSVPYNRLGVCQDCRSHPIHVEHVRAWGAFSGPLRQSIHALKYRRDVALGDSLSVHLIELLKIMGWMVDFVIPVPLGLSRQAERGYNQAALLARPLALAAGLLYQPDALRRVRETRTQVGLSPEARRSNVADAFQASASRISGKNILIVDDVITTGATIHACAAALTAAGAARIYGLSLARVV